MIYSFAGNPINTIVVTAMFEVYTSVNNSAKILEIGLCNPYASSNSESLVGMPDAAGSGPIVPNPLISEEDLSFSMTQVAQAWTTAPTAPSVYFRRVFLQGSTGYVLTFPRGAHIPPSMSLVVWMLTPQAVQPFWVVIDE